VAIWRQNTITIILLTLVKTVHRHLSYYSYITMAYGINLLVNALKKCMGWFPGVYSASAYSSAVLWNDLTTAGEGEALLTLSSSLKALVFCLLVTLIIYTRRSQKGLPPHPRRLPIIGNLFQAADKRWLSSRDCKERFGEYRALIEKDGNRVMGPRRGCVPRCGRKANNRLQQHEIGLRIP
jgi:hypothetical protein